MGCTARSHTSPTTCYARLSPSEQDVARGIFLRLAEPGVGTDDVRRRAPLDELVVDDEHAAVLTALVDHRLVVTNDATAEVAHEALLREWPRLRGWLEADREGRRVHRALANGAQEWAGGARNDDLLFRGSRLAAALDVAGAHPTEINPVERDFLGASRATRTPSSAPRRALGDRLASPHRRHVGGARGRVRRGVFSLVQRSRANDNAARAEETATVAEAERARDPVGVPRRRITPTSRCCSPSKPDVYTPRRRRMARAGDGPAHPALGRRAGLRLRCAKTPGRSIPAPPEG